MLLLVGGTPASAHPTCVQARTTTCCGRRATCTSPSVGWSKHEVAHDDCDGERDGSTGKLDGEDTRAGTRVGEQYEICNSLRAQDAVAAREFARSDIGDVDYEDSKGAQHESSGSGWVCEVVIERAFTQV